MLEIRETSAYAVWFAALRDRVAQARIDIRIRRLPLDNPADVLPVGDGVSELRIHYGPRYRVLFHQARTAYQIVAGQWAPAQSRQVRQAPAVMPAGATTVVKSLIDVTLPRCVSALRFMKYLTPSVHPPRIDVFPTKKRLLCLARPQKKLKLVQPI